jgi:hypothetical protein
LKPFLLVVLALIFATTFTRLDGRWWPSPAGPCAEQQISEQPILVVTKAGGACAAHVVGTGLYVRGETPRWAATSIGFALPLLLIAAAFVLAVRRLKGRARAAAGLILAGAGGYLFALTSTARYAEVKLLHGDWHQLGIWVNDPSALRDSLIWLGSGMVAIAGLWLLAMAAYWWRRQAAA